MNNNQKTTMENKSYYPLRIGALAGTIVSDTPIDNNHDMGHGDINYYGGYLIAESISRHIIAQQLVEAYNEKYGPKEESPDIDAAIIFLKRVEVFCIAYADRVTRPFENDGNIIQGIRQMIQLKGQPQKHHLNKTYSDPTLDEMIAWLDSICNSIIITDAEITTHIRKALVMMKDYQHMQDSPHGEVFYDENIQYTAKQVQDIMAKQPIRFVEKVDPKPIIKNLIELCELWGHPGGVKNDPRLNEARKYLGVEYAEPSPMDQSEEEFLSELNQREITPGDVINVALNEGSITPHQAIELMEVIHTDGWKNMLIQYQYENKAANLILEKRKDTIHKFNIDLLAHKKNEAEKKSMRTLVDTEVDSFISVISKFIETDYQKDIIESASKMISSLKSGAKLLSCGNGGSYSDAQHFASELSGKYRGVRPAIAAIALSDGGAMSCIANDFGFTHVFERQIEAIGRPQDTLLCLSTSGNSDNIILAANRAKSIGMNVVGISGNSGGGLKGHCDVFIEIPHSGTADRVQELSIVIIHILVNLIERGIS